MSSTPSHAADSPRTDENPAIDAGNPLLRPGDAAAGDAAADDTVVLSSGRGLGEVPIRQDLLRRNSIFEEFFHREAARLAHGCREMAQRFLAGGRLLAFGNGAAATDAQHVSVEFVHPVIVGKRALPALDLGSDFLARLPLLVRPQDMVMGFAFPQPDLEVESALRAARDRGALTFGLAAGAAEYHYSLPGADAFVCQELFECLYHVLWETVHVFFEHHEQGHDVGAASFLYPFLGSQEQSLDRVVEDVQQSMLQKAAEVNSMRTDAAKTEAESIAAAAEAIAGRLAAGGKVITMGNGGSATDANDLAADFIDPPPAAGGQRLPASPALSLAAEPAILTAVANDIGSQAIFTRQIMAHAQPHDVVIAFSTSGGSANILAALKEARRRGVLAIGIVGYDGGKMVSQALVDHALIVRSDYIPRIQEVQASLYHVLRTRVGELTRNP